MRTKSKQMFGKCSVIFRMPRTYINKIEKIMEQLGMGFVRCHQSYIVNCDKVKEYDYTDIMLCDGTHISVSRSYKNRIKEMFSDQDL